MLDSHVHVWAHEPGTPTPTYDLLASYCDAAETAGIQQIAITEHCTRFDRVLAEVESHWDRPRSGPLADATDHILAMESGGDLDAYVNAIVDAQNRGLPIALGLEVDHLPGAAEAMDAVLADYPFDVFLGSVHWLDAWLFDAYENSAFAQEWERRDTAEVWQRYVDAVVDLAASGRIDILAHIDVIKVAGHRPERAEEIEDRLITGLAGSNVVIEVSSAGWRKPAGEIYPSPRLLERLLAGGHRITTASDAHQAGQIGHRFDDLAHVLDEHGIDALTAFHERRPVSVPRDSTQ